MCVCVCVCAYIRDRLYVDSNCHIFRLCQHRTLGETDSQSALLTQSTQL